MRRWIQRILLIASTLLAAAAAALWVRSYWVTDALWYSPTPSLEGRTLHFARITLRTCSGGVAWLSVRQDIQMPTDARRALPLKYRSEYGWNVGPAEPLPAVSVLGFTDVFATIAQGGAGSQYRDVHVPCWFLVVAGSIASAIWLWRRWHQPLGPGHCQACGYNLTGNVSGVCPECGGVVRGTVEGTG
jgi:hypothetical protein